jgi:hypothetical protein
LVHLLNEINQQYSVEEKPSLVSDLKNLNEAKIRELASEQQSHFLQTGGSHNYLNLKRIQQFYFTKLENLSQIKVIRYASSICFCQLFACYLEMYSFFFDSNEFIVFSHI